jgi:hypothetical protein
VGNGEADGSAAGLEEGVGIAVGTGAEFCAIQPASMVVNANAITKYRFISFSPYFSDMLSMLELQDLLACLSHL